MPGLHGEAAAGTCDQHTNTTGPLYLLPVYSAVLYSTHCTVPRGDVWPVSALCQAALLWLPLSLAHGRIIISSCNHNLVFFNLYDDIHQIQYSAQYTTALFILERSGVRIFLNFLFVLSPPPILLLVSSIPSSSQNYVQTQLDISLDVDVTA